MRANQLRLVVYVQLARTRIVNVYAVCIPEERVHFADGEPPEGGVPVGIFVAETSGQAKRDALRAWTHRPMGVYTDDYPVIRARKIGSRGGPRGEIRNGDEGWWIRWPEGWPVIDREAVAV